MCLVVTPRVLEITSPSAAEADLYLLSVAMAPLWAVWPPTGDSQNTGIGRLWHIAFLSLVASMRPVAKVGLVPTILVMRWYAGPNFPSRPRSALDQRPVLVIAGIEETDAAEGRFRAASG